MYKKNFTKTISLFIVGLILGISSMSVFAYQMTTSESREYGPVLGYYYVNYSVCFGGDNYSGIGISAEAHVAKDFGGTAPAGYMGVSASLYKNGSLFASTAYIYNGIPMHVLSAWTNNYHDDGNYYATGWSKAYNGNGYNTYYVNASPIIQYID